MRGEHYHRQLDQHRGSGRPAVGPTMQVNDDGTVSPIRQRRRRDPIDVAFKIFAGILIWAGVGLAFFILYALAAILLRGR